MDKNVDVTLNIKSDIFYSYIILTNRKKLKVSLPSDISGMIYKRFTNSIEEVAYSIMKDLKASGYEIDR